MELKFDIKLSSGQKEVYKYAHDRTSRYIVLRFSRQCGKTVIAEILLIEFLCKRRTYNAYISPTFQLGRKVYNEITSLLESTNIIKKANASTLTIETIYGSTLQFFSVEGYTAIRGTTINGLLVLDECAYYPDILSNGEHIFGNVVMPITKAHYKTNKILLISTPCGKQGFYYDYFNRALNNEEGIVQVTRTIYDDNLVTEKQIEEIKQSIPKIAFEQEFECKFLDNALTFFTNFENCFKDNYTYDDNIKQYIGIDPSGNGSDECIVTKINEKLQVKQYKIKGGFDSKYTQISDIINNTYNLEGIYCEINGLGAPFFNELQKKVKRKSLLNEFNTSNSSKERILSNLATLIQQNKIQFNSEDTELYSQFSTFIGTYTKNHNLKLEAKQGFHDDRIMSLAIALECKNNSRQFTRDNYQFSIVKNNLIR